MNVPAITTRPRRNQQGRIDLVHRIFIKLAIFKLAVTIDLLIITNGDVGVRFDLMIG